MKRRDIESFSTVLEDAVTYLDAEVAGEIPSGDHRIFLARVIRGAVFDASHEPLVHVLQPDAEPAQLFEDLIW